MSTFLVLLSTFFASIGLLYLYIRANDAKIMRLPPEAATFSPKRWTEEDAKQGAKAIREKPVTIDGVLPPKTGRRYIVVGGVSLSFYFLAPCLVAYGHDHDGGGVRVGRVPWWMDRAPLIRQRRRPEENTRAGYQTSKAKGLDNRFGEGR